MSSKHVHIRFIVFVNLFLCTITRAELVCASAKNKEEPNYEIVNCKYPTRNITVDYQCKIYLNKELQTTNTQNVVEADFKLIGKITEQIQAIFYWKSIREHSHSNFYRIESEFKQNQTVPFSNLTNSLRASVVLYKINFETVYEICVKVPSIFGDSEQVCCEVENREEEEESNIFMSLIVLGVLVLIYAFVIIASLKMKHKEETMEDIIEQLPLAHVERLKSIIVPIDQEDDDNYDDDDDDDFDGKKDEIENAKPEHVELFVKNKKTKSAKKVTLRDHENHGYEPDEDEKESNRMHSAEEEMDQIEYNLFKEAEKFRKMSRMSIGNIASKDLARLRNLKNGKSVKFSEDTDTVRLAEIDKIKLKLNNESKRRASIKPFKKAYGLDVSDSD